MASPITATPLPLGTAIPDVPADLAAAVNNIEKFLIPRFTDATSRDAAIPSPADGQLVYVASVGFQKNVGGVVSGWTDVYTIPSVPAMNTGTVAITVVANATSGTATATFAAGRFSSAPNVITTPNSGASFMIRVGMLVYNITATSCTIGNYPQTTNAADQTNTTQWWAVERGF